MGFGFRLNRGLRALGGILGVGPRLNNGVGAKPQQWVQG